MRPQSLLPILLLAASAGLVRAQSPAPSPSEPAPSEPATSTEPAAAEPAPPPVEEAKPYFRQGRHRVKLGFTWNSGNTARDAGILAAPLTGEPGATNYPAATPLRVEMDSGGQFNLGYSYFFDSRWGLDLGLGWQPTKFEDPNFDLAEIDAQLATTVLTDSQKAHLRDRLIAHGQTHDASVLYLDVGAVRVFGAAKKWPFEVGGGIGWSFASLDDTTIGDRIVYERRVTSRSVNPGDLVEVANDVPADPAPGFVEAGCLADNDPCIEMTEADGLTWHVSATLHRAFNDHVMLDIGGRLRYVEQVLDPGDSFVTSELGVGISFLFGGR